MNSPRYALKNRTRFVTAASLFDGHDAAINVMRRLIQDGGAEVVHLGHNRAVADVVKAALEEDAHGVAVSSYQGGHMEYFRYMRELLDAGGGAHIRIFGGGGGVIVQDEIDALEKRGVDRIYSPEDGRRMGLLPMIDDLLERADFDLVRGQGMVRGQAAADATPIGFDLQALANGETRAVARAITLAEAAQTDPAALPDDLRARLAAMRSDPKRAPVVGITGTGGAGKSSLTDELLRRLLADDAALRVAVISVDPTRSRTGGALLGDRIRLNIARHPRCMVRSMATRKSGAELSAATSDAVAICQVAGFDLVIVETSGIGQGSSAVTKVADLRLYVMTPEFGAQSQLEKIDMLDFADMVVVNKFDRRGAEDALRDVRKQVRRNHNSFNVPDERLPVFGTIASQFNDPGVNSAYLHLLELLRTRTGRPWQSDVVDPGSRSSPQRTPVIPPSRAHYLGEITQTVRAWQAAVDADADRAHTSDALRLVAADLEDAEMQRTLVAKADSIERQMDPRALEALAGWQALWDSYQQDELVYVVRGREIRQPLVSRSLSGTRIPKVCLPRYRGAGDRLRWLQRENVPGAFPFTAGVFPLKRTQEEPKRMFAGEGGPARTNHRFHLLCKGEPVARLSTAFDSVTLYGEDPHERPDIYGKIGESGVSIAHLDDMAVLYQGFDLCAPTTSVSMTINGPAPILLAMFLNVAIDQQVDAFRAAQGRAPEPAEQQAIAARAISTVRGTVQADILKEDQAQNTCIFSLEFALRLMGDVQAWFIENQVRNYYSVSISGYHIAEAGANPISQLAYTLSNGFTFVEYYRSRGMRVDDFAPSLSFFFSNGMDPEYTVLGRVARRIWAVAMSRLYGADERSQKLKYHIQTSGRSLHAREIQFNDIRTTLQALLALQDNCNSLHTNAYDEAITTPTEESVRRAMAIQKIVNQEFGLMQNENPLQGAFIVEELTDLVEAAVLAEFDRIDQRGGVLGAMETQYQRGRIQDESLLYERLKHSGELPLIGVNTFLDPATTGDDWRAPEVELRRSTSAEKTDQIDRLRRFQDRNQTHAPAALARLQSVATNGGNVFGELMHTVRVASLGQITHALYAVGGEYRRNL
jgi:isobutyryl-CoA mutase